MKLVKDIYELFFLELTKVFIEKEFKDVADSKITKQSRTPWMSTRKGVYRSLVIAGSVSNDHEIFYRLRGVARTYGYAKEKDELFILAFKYMDVSFPSFISVKEIDRELEAKIFLQSFLEKNKEKENFLKLYPDLVVYNEESKFIKGSDNDPEVVAEKMQLLNSQIISNGFPLANYVIQAVHEFYGHISNYEILNASLMLTEPSIRTFDYNRFRLGYLWTDKILSTHVWGIEELNPDCVSCYVAFDEHINITRAIRDLNIPTPTSNEIDKIGIEISRITQELQAYIFTMEKNSGLINYEELYRENLLAALKKRKRAEDILAERMGVDTFEEKNSLDRRLKSSQLTAELSNGDELERLYACSRFYRLRLYSTNGVWKIFEILPLIL